MNIAGIVAEYNPFHRGHLYHIEQTKAQLGGDALIVCVMSGDFVQRGEAAVFSKFARSEAACHSGADLIVELPLPWCLSSAEGFARGAVSLLDRLSCQTISFGSEAGELNSLSRLAETLSSDEMNDSVRQMLSKKPNMSYAYARQLAVRERCGDLSALLETPNNILALEYLKAIRSLNSGLRAITVRRIGSPHDGVGGIVQSAAELRCRLQNGDSMIDMLPDAAAEVFMHEEQFGPGRPDPERLETALMSRLRMLSADDYEHLPDAADGLGRKLMQAAAEGPDLASVMEAVKSKRYAMSRIRRMICSATLGLRQGMASHEPPYARVLAANARGCELLHDLRGNDLPLIMKPAAVRELDAAAVECFELGSRAHDLFVLCSAKEGMRRGGMDWRTGPVIL